MFYDLVPADPSDSWVYFDHERVALDVCAVDICAWSSERSKGKIKVVVSNHLIMHEITMFFILYFIS